MEEKREENGEIKEKNTKKLYVEKRENEEIKDKN